MSKKLNIQNSNFNKDVFFTSEGNQSPERTMKFVILIVCLVAVFSCGTSQKQESIDDIDVEQFALAHEPEIHVDEDGHFVLRLVDDSGTAYEEEGFVVTDPKTGMEMVIAKKGTYTYPDKDGKLVRFTYDVDEPVAGVDAQ